MAVDRGLGGAEVVVGMGRGTTVGTTVGTALGTPLALALGMALGTTLGTRLGAGGGFVPIVVLGGVSGTMRTSGSGFLRSM